MKTASCDNIFNTPQETIDWAKSRIAEAKTSFCTYVQTSAFENITEFDERTCEVIQKIKLIRPIPREVTGNLTNALVDLKHSFDQSLFAVAQAFGCKDFDKNYPWADTLSGVKGIIDKRQRNKSTALPQTIIDEIFRQEPHGSGSTFNGVNNLIREVAKMVNDKHSIGFKVSASIVAMQMSDVHMSGSGSFFSNWDSDNEEIVLGRMKPGSNLSYGGYTLAVNIFFKRDGTIKKVSAFDAVNLFADRAQFVLDGFRNISNPKNNL